MTDKLKCCFCGAELNDYPDKTTGARMAVCRNPKCKYDGWHFPVEIIQQIIDGKKAQDALKSAKEYYVIVRGYGKEQHYISYSTGVDWFWNWDLDHAEPFDTIQDAKDQIRVAKIPNARVMKVRRITEITSITKQGE